jgi:hypothetical protein
VITRHDVRVYKTEKPSGPPLSNLNRRLEVSHEAYLLFLNILYEIRVCLTLME